MLNNFKATVRKWANLPYADLCNFFSWLDFNKSNVEFNNQNLLVASATNERGETVCYTTAEPIFLVNAYSVSPSSTPEEAQQGGDAIDITLAGEARKAGVNRLLIVVPADTPHQPGEKWLRVIERKVPQETITAQQRIGCLDSATRLLLN